MQVTVHNSERFNRSKWWYVGFSSVFASILTLSILYNNIPGAILLFFLLGGYFYYYVSNNQLIKISDEKDGLVIGPKKYSWTNLVGYVLEIDNKTQKIKNIVFITRNGHSIHTFHDSDKNIKNFIISLNDHLPMLGEYDQSFLDRLTRILQL